MAMPCDVPISILRSVEGEPEHTIAKDELEHVCCWPESYGPGMLSLVVVATGP